MRGEGSGPRFFPFNEIPWSESFDPLCSRGIRVDVGGLSISDAVACGLGGRKRYGDQGRLDFRFRGKLRAFASPYVMPQIGTLMEAPGPQGK